MFRTFGRMRMGLGQLLITLIVFYVLWGAFVRPALFRVSQFYWWMRP